MRDMFGKMAEMKYGTISFATNQRSLSKVRIVVTYENNSFNAAEEVKGYYSISVPFVSLSPLKFFRNTNTT